MITCRKFFTPEQEAAMANPRSLLRTAVYEQRIHSVIRCSPPELLEEALSVQEARARADRFEEWWVWDIEGLPLLGWPDDELPRHSQEFFASIWWIPSPKTAKQIEAVLRDLGAREPNPWIAAVVERDEPRSLRELAEAVDPDGWYTPWEEGFQMLSAPTAAYISALSPDVVIDLLDRIAELEARIEGAIDTIEGDDFWETATSVQQEIVALIKGESS